MSLLVLDPQGEFSKIDDGRIRNFVNAIGKRIDIYDLSQLILLPDWDLFKKILIDSQFLKRLGIRADDNQRDAADQIVKILRSRAQTLNDTMGEISPIWRTRGLRLIAFGASCGIPNIWIIYTQPTHRHTNAYLIPWGMRIPTNFTLHGKA